MAELVTRYTTYLAEHPTTSMPNSSKPTVWTGTRKLSPTDWLLAALTCRWHTPRRARSPLRRQRAHTLAPAIRQTIYDLDELGHTVPRPRLTATTVQQLATITAHEL